MQVKKLSVIVEPSVADIDDLRRSLLFQQGFFPGAKSETRRTAVETAIGVVCRWLARREIEIK